jgi:hypothetical protein
MAGSAPPKAVARSSRSRRGTLTRLLGPSTFIPKRKAVEAELPILLVSTLDWILAGNFARIGI